MKQGQPKNAKNDLAAVNAELEAKIAELAQANLALYETGRAKSEFVANMSHELRTPLNSIIGFADVLLGQLKGVAPDEQIRYLGNIRKAGYRLLELLSELMNFARLESGGLRVNAGPVSVQGLVSEVVTNLRNAHAAKNFDWRIEIPDDTPTVMADEVKLNQILTNLGANAAKFTPDRGSITFGGGLDGTRLTLFVRDSGMGIDDEEQKVIFQRFRQADRGPARKYEGMGLGLYIVKALVELMGGDVSLESRKGRGATFKISIPVELIEL